MINATRDDILPDTDNWPAPIGSLKDPVTNAIFVPSSDYVLMRKGRVAAHERIDKAASDIVGLFEELAADDKKYAEGVFLTLEMANALLVVLGMEEMKNTQQYSFTVNVSFEIRGYITADDEDQAHDVLEDLAGNCNVEYYEPSLPEGVELDITITDSVGGDDIDLWEV